MKKSLIALAALAAVSAASAQSSVTLYGVVDIGYGSQVTDGRGTGQLRSSGVMDGANAGNRIGFRGTEELGGGLKANFVVEQGINPTGGGLFVGRASSAAQQVPYPTAFSNNLGALGSIPGVTSITASTNRQSYIGFSGATWGTINAGYQYNNMYELASFSGYNIGSEGMPGAAVSHTFGGSFVGGTRSTGLTYISPDMSGFTLRFQYGGNGAAHEVNTSTAINGVTTAVEGRRWSLMGKYVNGPLSAAIAHTSNRLKNDATPTLVAARTGTLTNVGASYDFGPVKLAGTYNNGRDGGIGATTLTGSGVTVPVGTSTRYRAYQLGVSAPFGALVPYATVGRAYTETDGVAARTIDVKQAQIGARYSLSKRTTAYVMYGRATDEAANTTNLAVYKDRKTLVGVQHNF